MINPHTLCATKLDCTVDPKSHMAVLTRRLGDLDGDGFVGRRDFTRFLKFYQSQSSRGDINGDGQVNRKDMLIIKGYMGHNVGKLVEDGLKSRQLGDLNGDNRLDFDDYAIYDKSFNTGSLDGDVNMDGKVNRQDQMIMDGYFGCDWTLNPRYHQAVQRGLRMPLKSAEPLSTPDFAVLE